MELTTYKQVDEAFSKSLIEIHDAKLACDDERLFVEALYVASSQPNAEAQMTAIQDVMSEFHDVCEKEFAL